MQFFFPQIIKAAVNSLPPAPLLPQMKYYGEVGISAESRVTLTECANSVYVRGGEEVVTCSRTP